MYPEHELYFLSREVELLSDTARVLTDKEKPSLDAKRIHHLNVSSANLYDQHLKEYLEQEGITEASLRSGKKILFIDTGFTGTSARSIIMKYPPDVRKQFQIQLLCSTHANFPSSRVFIIGLDSAASSVSPISMVKTVEKYKDRPRYTDRSDHYEKMQGQWIPISPDSPPSPEGSVSKNIALAEMEDLKYYLNQNTTEQLYQQRKAFWHGFHEKLKTQDKKAVLNHLVELFFSNNPKATAMINDALEIVQCNFPSQNHLLPTTRELDLAVLQIHLRPNTERERPKDPNEILWGKLSSAGSSLPAGEDAEFIPPTVTAQGTQVQVSGPYMNLTIINHKIKQALEKISDPKEAVVVLDVDDTLILRGKPMKDHKYVNRIGEGTKFVERPGARELLQLLKDKGVQVVISSAHPTFSETLLKLEDIGALSLFGMAPDTKSPESSQIFSVHVKGQKGEFEEYEFEGYHIGKVSSVKSAGQTYFDHKFISMHLVLSAEDRLKVKTVLFVDDSPDNHRQFFFEMLAYAPVYLPHLAQVQTFELSKTKGSKFEQSFQEAGAISESVDTLYHESYFKIAPTIIASVDRFLRRSLPVQTTSVPKLYFLAPTGLGGYEVAQALMKKFPNRYYPLTQDSFHSIHLNKNTIQDPELTKEYLIQNGLQPGSTAYFYDLIDQKEPIASSLQTIVQKAGGKFGGLYLTFYPSQNPNTSDLRPKLISGYIQTTLREPPFLQIPADNDDDAALIKKQFAIKALKDAALDLDEIKPDELNSLNTNTTQSLLFRKSNAEIH